MSGIFISYRQDDAKSWALLLREELVKAFGEAHVFLDKDTLHAGNWREQIREALDRCGVMLVVMGRRWLTIADEHGERRLDRTDDIHRQEIAYALSRKDITVIPVRVDGAPIPRPEELPPALRRFPEQQSRDLSDSSAHREVDLKLLIEDIERATGLKAARASRIQTRNAPMADEHERKTGPVKSYTIGNIGAHARVAVGEHITWTENNFAGIDQGAELAEKFTALLKRIETDCSLDDAARELSVEKTKKVAEELASAARAPDSQGPERNGAGLRRAVMDAKSWLASTATWAWDELQKILSSDAAQKTLRNITSTAVKVSIKTLLGLP
jgi:hypothetical protein